MQKQVMRTFEMPNGRRTGIRLEPLIWTALESLAERAGITWQEWVRRLLIEQPPPRNMTALVRSRVTDAVFETSPLLEQETTMQSRPEDHPLLKYSEFVSDAELAADMRRGTVAGSKYLGGFTLHWGTNHSNQACIWLENQLKAHESVRIASGPLEPRPTHAEASTQQPQNPLYGSW